MRDLFLLAFCLSLYLPMPNADAQAGTRPSLEDVLSLTDIGERSAILEISPDGASVAFVERRRRFASNDFEHQVIIVDIETGARRALAEAGDAILTIEDGRQSGSLLVRAARFSPDGRTIAYLRRIDDRIELWRVSTEGGDAWRVAPADGDVVRFAWTDDGALVFETLTPRAELERVQAQAVQFGFRVDERVDPRYALAPMPDTDGGRRTWVADGADIRDARPEEAILLRTSRSSAPTSPNLATPLRNARGDRAWIGQVDTASRAYRAPLTIYAESASADAPLRCNECAGAVTDSWILPSGVILFLKTEGFARSLRGLYRWEPSQPAPTLIRREEEVLLGCALQRSTHLVCLQERTLQPRRVVALDLESGALRVIYDPNPDWAGVERPRLERIDVHDFQGEESFGRLFYPYDYDPSRRYPAIFIQYRARGFLRSGVGGEYPIYGFLQRGYFVIVVEKPDHERLWAHTDLNAAAPLTELTHIEQRSKQSALDRILEVLRRRGDIDMDRIAITGLSDGAETTYWALTHSDAFAVALTSSPPNDPMGLAFGSEASRQQRRADFGVTGGWDDTSPRWRRYWRNVSPSLHVERLRTPLLMQLAATEATTAFPLLTRMREHNRAVELYLYPGAHHLKTAPQQLLATQYRALDWVDFWLRDVLVEDPSDPGRGERWRAMRAAHQHATSR